MSYELITFDLDGTLVDSASEIAEAANRALEDHGIERRRPEQVTPLIGAGTRELMLQLLARCFVAQPALADRIVPDDVLASMDEHYASVTGSMAQPYQGCRDALSALRAAGVRLACVTNKELRHARRLLQATGLDGYFSLLIAGDTLAAKKPHASVLRHVAKALGADLARCAHVGDSAIDVAAARNAGVAAWAVPYGYNAGRPIAESMPDRIFDTLPQVAAYALAVGAPSSLA